MVDFSQVSRDLAGRIEKIMNGEGQDAKKIDSRAEYKQLADLLSGKGKVSGDEAIFVKELMTDYEEEYMVSKGVKERVLEIIKFGVSNKADDNSEIKDLKNYKKTSGLTKEEKTWIQKVIDGRIVKTQEAEQAEDQKGIPAGNNETPKTKQQEQDKNNEPLPQKKGENNKTLPQKKEPVTVVNNDNSNDKDGVDNKGAKQKGQIITVNENNGMLIINQVSSNEGLDNSKDAEGPNNDNTTKKMSQEELNALAQQIFDAVDGFGTKEEQLQNALKDITKDNILELLTTYNQKHSDMFEAIVDDLSGNNYTKAVNILKNALLERAKGTPVESQVANTSGKIENELNRFESSDSTVVENLNEMARLIRNYEKKL